MTPIGMNTSRGDPAELPPQAEGKRLEERELLWSTLVEMAGDGFEMVDEDGRYLQINAASCAALGYTREELLGMTVYETDPGLTPESFKAQFKALAGGPSVTFEAVHRKKDGTDFPIELTVKVILLGDHYRALVQARDISERKRAEEEQRLLHAQVEHLQRIESIGQLAGGVAHEINNVLASIMAVSELLKRRRDDVAPQAELILQAGGRGRDIIKALLDFSRRGMEGVSLLDLNEVIQKEMEVLSSTTGQKIRIQLDLQPGLPKVLMEEGALTSAIMNLCLNAVDAMPNGGTLTLRTNAAFADMVRLSVEDTGHGMTEEVRVRAMEPFFTTKPFGKGTGLGLSTVYGMVKAHGGAIDIESSPGEGTQVRLMLPTMPKLSANQAAEADLKRQLEKLD